MSFNLAFILFTSFFLCHVDFYILIAVSLLSCYIFHPSSKMSSEFCIDIQSDNLQRNASNLFEKNFIMQQDNHPKHIVNTTTRMAKSITRL